jgi:hypothetical protein
MDWSSPMSQINGRRKTLEERAGMCSPAWVISESSPAV